MKKNISIFIFIIVFLLISSSLLIFPKIPAKTIEIDSESIDENIRYYHLNKNDVSFDILQNKGTLNTVFIDLPDLEFIELKAWWGPINTSETGLFVRYGVINTGFEINGTIPVESNLSFFADDNQSHFGYIIQKPLFYPTHWYPGEILGGNFFFDIDERPTTISVFIDSNESIEESDETNNILTINVIDGISVIGNVYYDYNDELIPIQSSVELKQCDKDSLADHMYRTFRTDENGSFSLSIYPTGDKNISYSYGLIATDIQTGMKSICQTPELLSGQETMINFVFEGSAPNTPQKPFGRKSGSLDHTYRFITVSNDLDSNEIYYKFSWGDRSYSDWLGPFDNSDPVITSHRWETEGTYEISVIAKDSTGLLSTWSESYHITLATQKPLPSFLLFLQEILEQLLPK